MEKSPGPPQAEFEIFGCLASIYLSSFTQGVTLVEKLWTFLREAELDPKWPYPGR